MSENRLPAPQEIYRHFKGNLYQIITLAEKEDTGETLVIYQALYGQFKIYARTLSSFTSRVDKEKYPAADQEYRFEKVLLKVVSRKEKKADSADGPDPKDGLMRFLDAKTISEKLSIMKEIRTSVTDEMIDTMAIASDVQIKAGDTQKRFEELRECLIKRSRYELSRAEFSAEERKQKQ